MPEEPGLGPAGAAALRSARASALPPAAERRARRGARAGARAEDRELAVELIEPLLARGGGEFVAGAVVAADRARLRRDPPAAARARARAERAQRGVRARAGAVRLETAERENQLLYAECREIVPSEGPTRSTRPRTSSARCSLPRRRRRRVRRRQPPPAPDRGARGADGALASAVDHLAATRELQAALRADPALIPARSRSCCGSTRRTRASRGPRRATSRSAAARSGAGEMAALVLPSANRDPEVFDEPGGVPARARRPAPRLRPRAAQVPGRARRPRSSSGSRSRSCSPARRVRGRGPVEMVPWPLYGPASAAACAVSGNLIDRQLCSTASRTGTRSPPRRGRIRRRRRPSPGAMPRRVDG